MKPASDIERRVDELEREVLLIKEANQLRAMADRGRHAAQSSPADQLSGIVERVTCAACQIFSCSRKDIRSRNRHEDICWARHAVFALTSELSGCNCALLGRTFHRDHGSVANAIKRIADADKSAPVLVQEKLKQLRRELQGSK